MNCEGSGSPTVIMESGLPFESEVGWYRIRRKVATFTRACEYSRAGVQPSEARPEGSEAGQVVVGELQRLLENAGIEGPYVLVGFGRGGILVRLYAGQHPDQVVGMVLMDSEHPDQRERLEEFLPASWDWMGSESVWEDHSQHARAIRSLGDMPLVVLTAEWHGFVGAGEEAWLQMQQELAGISSNGTQITVEGTGHGLETFKSALVSDAIREVVEAARGQ
jgi:pimeloyl-ACP methyl ester carboxylesterase